MFGLSYLAWLVLTATLFGYVVRHLVLVFRDATTRRRSAGRLALLIACFAFVTWPFLLGRAVFQYECHAFAGLRIYDTVDLRNEGYLILPKGYDIPSQQGARNVYDNQALQDLLTGRIAYFEKPLLSLPGETRAPYERFALGSAHSKKCRNPDPLLAGIPLPADQCLTRSNVYKSRARYHLRIASNNKSIEFVDSIQNKRLAIFRSFSHWSGWIADAGELTFRCPSPAESPGYTREVGYIPQRALSAFALMDRNGQVVTEQLVAAWQASVPEGGSRFFAEIPPRQVTQPAIQ